MNERWSEWLHERAGPIVVKEVRQGLRSKAFAVFFTVLLVACLLLSLLAVAANDSPRRGQEFFTAFFVALGAVCFFVIPISAYRSMAKEREDETWVLLTLTGLGPEAIARGKFVSALAQALLYGSACAPFIVFSYFLNGVSVLVVAMALAGAVVWTMLIVSVVLAIATQAHARLMQVFSNLVVIGLCGFASLVAMLLAAGLASSRKALDSTAGWAFVGVIVMSLGLTQLALASSAAGLCLSSEAASRGPRKALLALMVLVWVFPIAVTVSQGAPSRNDVAAGAVFTCFFLAIVSPFAVSEFDGWPRAASTGGWLKPGAYRGFVLMVVLLVVTSLLWLGIRAATNTLSIERGTNAVIAAPLYVILYMSLAVLVGRATPLAKFGEPTATRAAWLSLCALGSVVSAVVSALATGDVDAWGWNLFSPTLGLMQFLDRSNSAAPFYLVVLGFVTVVAGFSALGVLASRDRERT